MRKTSARPGPASAFMGLTMWALRDLWDRTVEDAGWKFKLYAVAFVLLVVPTALGDHFGLPFWITFPVFLAGFAALTAVWLGLRLHDATGPWHLEEHVKRIGAEVQREHAAKSGLPAAPEAVVVDLTATPMHVLETLGRLFGTFGRRPGGRPPRDQPPRPPAPPPLAVA